jgi:hypothetical protein
MENEHGHPITRACDPCGEVFLTVDRGRLVACPACKSPFTRRLEDGDDDLPLLEAERA